MFDRVFDVNFNNQSTLNDIKIKCVKRPNIPIPKRKTNTIKIPGRDGDVVEDEGAYEDIIIPIQFNFLDRTNFHNKLRLVRKWLLNITDNKLTFSDDPDYFYKVKIVNCDEIERQLKVFGYFEVKFTCDPFQYSYNGIETIKKMETNSLITFYNDGYFSLPYIKLLGSYGIEPLTITLTTESAAIDILKDVSIDGYIEINSEIMDCYKGTLNYNNIMNGKFPIFAPGKNTLTWSGNAIGIEVIPNWRCL